MGRWRRRAGRRDGRRRGWCVDPRGEAPGRNSERCRFHPQAPVLGRARRSRRRQTAERDHHILHQRQRLGDGADRRRRPHPRGERQSPHRAADHHSRVQRDSPLGGAADHRSRPGGGGRPSAGGRRCFARHSLSRPREGGRQSPGLQAARSAADPRKALGHSWGRRGARCDRQSLAASGEGRQPGAHRFGARALHAASPRGESDPAVPRRVAAPAPPERLPAKQFPRGAPPRLSGLRAPQRKVWARRKARWRRPQPGPLTLGRLALEPLAHGPLTEERPAPASPRRPAVPASWLPRRARRAPGVLGVSVRRRDGGPRPDARRLQGRADGRRVRFATGSDCPPRPSRSIEGRPRARAADDGRRLAVQIQMLRQPGRPIAGPGAAGAAPPRLGARQGRGDAWSPPPPSWSGHG
jgi:hypothetical protein